MKKYRKIYFRTAIPVCMGCFMFCFAACQTRMKLNPVNVVSSDEIASAILINSTGHYNLTCDLSGETRKKIVLFCENNSDRSDDVVLSCLLLSPNISNGRIIYVLTFFAEKGDVVQFSFGRQDADFFQRNALFVERANTDSVFGCDFPVFYRKPTLINNVKTSKETLKIRERLLSAISENFVTEPYVEIAGETYIRIVCRLDNYGEPILRRNLE
ncbi:MAG: hypothetical protein LBD14_06515 [Puniceicoccales bacterium]|jgi:hypothetical protein|nr:hypothetical protein [Puniceicoccales bacterium]